MLKFILNILNYFTKQVNYIYFITRELLLNYKIDLNNLKFLFNTWLFVVFIFISKEIIIFNEEVLVVISFFLFVMFLYSKINSMIYFELFVRDDKLSRELDINAFLHQEILSNVLNLDKIEISTSDKIINEQKFISNTFLPSSKIVNTLKYVKINLDKIKSNLIFLTYIKQAIYNDLETRMNSKVVKLVYFYTYFLLKINNNNA